MLKNDKYITPFLKEEKILLNSSTNNFSGTLNRRYLYSYEGAYENAPKYKNIYGYEEDTTVSGENVAQVYKREYEYTEGSNFIKKEIIKKAQSQMVNLFKLINCKLIIHITITIV